MLHPVGSLPPRVYWRRRAAGLCLALLLILVPILLITGGEDESAATDGAPVAQGATDPAQLDLVPAEGLTAPPSSSLPTGPLPTTGAPSTGAPSTGVPTSGAPSTGAPTSGAPTSSPPAESAPPAACSNAVIAVTAGSTQPQWLTRDKPVFTMTITNAGTTACQRDVGTNEQEWGLFDGDQRLWGSNDCQFEPGTDVRTLQPGEQVTVSVTWSGLTSQPGCDAPRERLAGGDYQLRAWNTGARSENFTVTLR